MRQRLFHGIWTTSVVAVLVSAALPLSAMALGVRILSSIVIIAAIWQAGSSHGASRNLRTRLRHPDPWTLISASFIARSIADVAIVFNATLPAPAINAVMLPLAAVINGAALIQMMRQRFGERAREYVAEVLISSSTVLLVLWAIYIGPHFAQANMSGVTPAFGVIGVTWSLPMFLGSLFMTLSFTNKPRSLVLYSGSQFVNLILALDYFASSVSANFVFDRVAFILVAIAPTLIGLAAVHSSMDIYEEPTSPQGARLTRTRLLGLIMPVVLGPLILLLSVTGTLNVAPMTIATFSIVLGLMVVGHLLTMVQARASSTHWASHDKLTGLPNRALFRERIAAALDRSRKLDHNVAIMYLDLDRFKHINDSMGHEAGDQLLEQVARRILANVDASDTVARLGGDEFAILINEVEDDELPRKLARRLLKAFATPFNLKPRPVFMSPSIGIAVSEPNMNLETVLTCADTAMYRAKECGRNNFAVWSHDMNQAAKNRLMLETSLHTAISNHELRLVYQPKVSLQTGNVVGVEALIRWHHPKLGVISPGAFIHLAEETGLIIQIGEWVLVEACRQGRVWYDNGYQELSVAVNLSSRQFQQPGLTDLVARVLRETGLPSHLLELELTESMAMTGADSTVTTLEDLRQMGVKCSIDDFGTGYSNLSYLSQFPIDALKIDKAFVQSIDQSAGDAALVVAIIAMAHGLGMRTIGEGVETLEQVSFLTKHGCDEIQGFLFSKPIPPQEIESLLMLEHVSNGSGRLGLSGPLNADFGAEEETPLTSTATQRAVPTSILGAIDREANPTPGVTPSIEQGKPATPQGTPTFKSQNGQKGIRRTTQNPTARIVNHAAFKNIRVLPFENTTSQVESSNQSNAFVNDDDDFRRPARRLTSPAAIPNRHRTPDDALSDGPSGSNDNDDANDDQSHVGRHSRHSN